MNGCEFGCDADQWHGHCMCLHGLFIWRCPFGRECSFDVGLVVVVQRDLKKSFEDISIECGGGGSDNFSRRKMH